LGNAIRTMLHRILLRDVVMNSFRAYFSYWYYFYPSVTPGSALAT
jgi:hypothetical protein